MSCESHGERIARHNILRDANYATAVSAALLPKKVKALITVTGTRSDDVYISHWTYGHEMAFNVTVINPDKLVDHIAATPGH